MKLRIISGELKGRYINILDAAEFRPTKERVRESVAEIAKRRFAGAVAADICAGTGAFGFEMLSRGAVSVDFVDADKRAVAKISENALALGVDGRVRAIRDDVCRYIGSCAGAYDVIFYDPPYDDAELQALVPKILLLLKEDGLLIYERRRRPHEKKHADKAGLENLIDTRIYADTVIEFYTRGDLESSP